MWIEQLIGKKLLLVCNTFPKIVVEYYSNIMYFLLFFTKLISQNETQCFWDFGIKNNSSRSISFLKKEELASYEKKGQH